MASPVTGVDFVAVPSTDWKRSRVFYVDTLGLRPDERGDGEFWVGETCFGIYEPTTFGMEFAPQKTAHLALHVEDIAAARVRARGEGHRVPSARPSTRASATWRSSRIPTATP